MLGFDGCQAARSVAFVFCEVSACCIDNASWESTYHQLLHNMGDISHQSINHVQRQTLAYDYPQNLGLLLVGREGIIYTCQPQHATPLKLH